MDSFDINFTRNLIKGRIAETIFEQMFKATGKYTVLPLGYENTMPELAQYQHYIHIKKVLDNLRSTPDFALINEDKTDVMLVEVKYRNHIDLNEITELSKEINIRWNPCYLFVATQTTFYFTKIEDIINKRTLDLLSEQHIPEYITKQSIQLLKESVQ